MSRWRRAGPDGAVGGARGRRTQTLRTAAALAGLGALLAAWILGNPPNATPDEPANLLRAYAAGVGQWSGRAATPIHAGLGAQRRVFDVPARFDVLNATPCFSRRSGTTPADCSPYLTLNPRRTAGANRALSPSGGYYPVMWVPLGLAVRVTGSITAATYAARAAAAVLSAALLVLALGCLRRRVERLGWLVALGPLTVFTAASAATNGLEVCGAIAVVCGIHAVRDGRRRTGLTAFVAGSVALTSAKAFGPVWWVVVLVLAAAVGRFRGWRPPWWAWVAPVLLGVGNLLWSARFPPHDYSGIGLRDQIHLAVRQVNHLPEFTYSKFGLANVDVQHDLWRVGVAGYVAFLVACLLRTDWWGRAVVVAATAAAWLAAVVFTVLEIQVGFGMQARYTLAVTAVVPLLASHAVVARRRPGPAGVRRLLDWPVVVAVGGAALAANALARFFDLRRYTSGVDARGVLGHVVWRPPGGLALQLGLTLGGLLLLAAVVVVGRDGAEQVASDDPDAAPVGPDRPGSPPGDVAVRPPAPLPLG